jgi:hypothetical protein
LIGCDGDVLSLHLQADITSKISCSHELNLLKYIVIISLFLSVIIIIKTGRPKIENFQGT